MTTLYRGLKIGGCAAPDGKQFITLARSGPTFVTPRGALFLNPDAEFKRLMTEGFAVTGRGQAAQILEDATSVSDFPEREVLQDPGWSGSLFARPDGLVLAPSRTKKLGKEPIAGFHRHPSRYRCTGRRKKWAREVAGLVADDDFAVFAAGLALAPAVRPLLSQPTMPLAIELISDRNSQSIKRFTLSVTGTMGEDLVTDPMKDLVAEPARYIGNSHDSLLIVGEANGYLCGAADRKRATAVRLLVFDHLLAQEGGETNVSGGRAPSFVLIEKRPMNEMLELDGEAAERLGEALLTICIPPLDHDGESVEERLSRSSERSWSEAARKATNHHGKALKSFQEGLVEWRSKDGFEAVQLSLDKQFDKFFAKARKMAAAFDHDDAHVHPFALIATSLWVAKKLEILPFEKSKDSVLRVLGHHLGTRPAPVTAASTLKELAARPDVIAIDAIDDSHTRKVLEAAPAFIKNKPGGIRELWILTDQKKTVFDWSVFSKLPDFPKWFCGKGEKDRHGSKRVIGAWKGARVLRFRLPEDE